MKIAIFSKGQNKQCHRIVEVIQNQLPNIECSLYNMNLSSDDLICLDNNGIYFNNNDISKLNVAYIHGFQFMMPVVPEDNYEKDWSFWNIEYLKTQQKYSTLLSCFKEMERRGVKLINSPQVMMLNFMKPYFLEKLRIQGFCIPRMLCSNDVEGVNAFCKENEETLWRPSTGRAMWQIFRKKQQDFFVKPELPPVLLAELISGNIVRCFLFDGKPLLFLNAHYPINSPVEKLEVLWSTHIDGIANELEQFVQETGVVFACLTLVINDGKIWIYDVDPDPILDGIPENYFDYMINALAYAICQIPQKVSIPEGATERSGMMLRRMYQILFDMERSKFE